MGAAIPVRIPLSRTAAELHAVWPEVHEAFAAIAERGVFRGGEQAAALERELAAFLGAREAVAVASGGLVITIALLALGVEAGDEVVVASNVDVSLAAPISHAGARIVWCDVDERTLTADPAAVERAIGPRTRVVVAVHLYGNPAQLDELGALARRHGVALLEDVSHAPGATWRGRACGTLGAVGCISLSSGKPLGAAGSAGALVTGDAALAARARVLAAYGLEPQDLHDTTGGATRLFRCRAEGFNAMLDEWQSAILRAKLRRLSAWNARRREQCERYRARLRERGDIHLQASHAAAAPVPRHLVLRTARREELVAHLERRGIGCGIGYIPPLHTQPLYRARQQRPACLPRTEQLARELLVLPIHPLLRDDEIDAVADAVLELLGEETR